MRYVYRIVDINLRGISFSVFPNKYNCNSNRHGYKALPVDICKYCYCSDWVCTAVMSNDVVKDLRG